MATIGNGTVLGGYLLVEQLGVGGMGEVWKARNTRLERMERAVKVIRVDLSQREDYRARFLREAEVLEQLQHPNILHVYDLGEQDGVLFLTMELLRGRSIDRIIKDGEIPFERVIDIGAQALAGIGHAHRATIIHRDIKPANIFLQDDGVVKVLDFGIARGGAGTGSLTSTGMAPGSPAYFAPEFADGAPASPASDVYSMGITLFQMATGRLPFEAGGGTPSQAAISLMVQHAAKPIPDVTKLRAGVPPALAQAIVRATTKRPTDRPSADELAAMLSGKPLAQSQVPTTPRTAAPPKSAAPIATDPASTTLSPPTLPAGAATEPLRSRRSPLWAIGGILAVGVAGFLASEFGIVDRIRGVLSPATPTAVAIVSTAPVVTHTEPPPSPAASVSPAPAVSPPPPSAAASPHKLVPAPSPHVKVTFTPSLHWPSPSPPMPTPTPAVIAAGSTTGFFTVFADPWCEVWVDGKRIADETPLKHYKLSAGRHSVRMVNPDHKFTKESSIEVPADGEIKLIVDVKANTIRSGN